MIKAGLTGNIGSGKTVVANIFKVLRIPVYNADEQARGIMHSPDVLKKIVKLFGKSVLDNNGNPDKKKIAQIVFPDKQMLEKLNSLIHPLVIADFKKWAGEQKNASYVIMESAILFETAYTSLFDKIIFVSAPETIRIKRVMERDAVDAIHVKNRIKRQLPEDKKIKKADFVVFNDNKNPLIPQVLSIHQQFLTLC